MIMQNTPKEKTADARDSNWSDDQREREYYYDDAHGYEKFDPEEKDDDDRDEDVDDEGANSSGGAFDVDLD